MLEIIQSHNFNEWLQKVDSLVKARVLARLSRVEMGNFGDHSNVSDGISELRLFFGAGYRIYYMQQGLKLVILLCAGDKSTQSKDIRLAKKIAHEWHNHTIGD